MILSFLTMVLNSLTDNFFRLFLTDVVVDKLVLETNEYDKQTINAAKAKGPLTKYAHFKNWTEIDRKTM